MGQRLYFDLLTAKAAAQRANEESKRSAAHPPACFTSAAASLGALSILLSPGHEAAPVSVGSAEAGRAGTAGLGFLPSRQQVPCLPLLSVLFRPTFWACLAPGVWENEELYKKSWALALEGLYFSFLPIQTLSR